MRLVLFAVCLALACAQYDPDDERSGSAEGIPYYGDEEPYYGGDYPGEGPYPDKGSYYGGEPYYGGGDYGGEGPYNYGGDQDPYAEPTEGDYYGGMFENMDFSMIMNMEGVDVWGEMMKNIPFDEILDNRTASGMVPAFEAIWKLLESDMCETTADTCSPGAVTFLDCNCVRQFNKMKNERCNGVTCTVYQGVLNNLAKWVGKLRTLTSFEEFMAFFNDEIMTDVMMYVCDCKSEIFRSTISCVSKYDTPMLREMLGAEDGYMMFKGLMKQINWKSIQKLAENVARHSCSEVKGVQCFNSYFKMWEAMAAMFDKTFSGQGQSCDSFIDVIQLWVTEVTEFSDFASYLSGAFKINKKWWCNAKCANTKLNDIWSDCCVVGWVKDRTLVNSVIGIVNNILPIISQGEMDKLPKQIKRQMRTMADPLQMCTSNKKTTKVWRDVVYNCKNEQDSFYDVFK